MNWALINNRQLGLGLLLLAAASLGFAYYSEIFWGLHPCVLCLWQRLPWALLGLVGIGMAAYPAWRGWHYAALLLLATGLGLAFYHAGVEQRWWAGTAACGASAAQAGQPLSYEELLAQLETTPVTRCDVVSWYFLGLSMAAWNAILNMMLLLGVFCHARQR